MGIDDKVKNAAEEAKGKAEEAWGKATGNEAMEARGRADQLAAEAKKATEKAADKLKEGVGRLDETLTGDEDDDE
jgi:uncharacterized protein YjbJ (UPF0337 family)